MAASWWRARWKSTAPCFVEDFSRVAFKSSVKSNIYAAIQARYASCVVVRWMSLITRMLAAGALVVASAAPVLGVRAGVRPLASVKTWAVYYGAAPETAPALARFDLVVLDPGAHPPLDAVTASGARVLMYVSLAEVNVNHRHYPIIAGESWVLEPNANWPEARRLDVRAPGYEEWLFGRVIGSALAGGAHGLFLDTADTALEMERTDPARWGGAGAALERILKRLRRDHAGMLVVLNGGTPLAEAVDPALLDGVASESIWSNYDFAAKKYLVRPPEEAALRAAPLRRLTARGLPVLTLEYAPPDARESIARMIARSRDERFVPYVATIGLGEVFTLTLPR
jgi:hypothetical protein